MRTSHILKSWGKVLLGHTPLLSIEITRECPLRCPGCYAYGTEHLGGEVTLRELLTSGATIWFAVCSALSTGLNRYT